MKSLSFGYKIIFFFNNIFAVLLVFSYLTSFISPRSFPLSAILNFSIPILWLINLGFALLWFLKLKKHIFLSLIAMALGWFHLQKIFVFSNTEYIKNQGLKVMNYNVMQFYSLVDNQKSTYEDIKNFVYQENPSIFCVQEFKYFKEPTFQHYKYNTVDTSNLSLQSAIYSHYPILNLKRFDFEDSGNSAVYADIAVNQDTIRVFSVHFQSLNLKPDLKKIQDEPKEKLLKRLENTFNKQIRQFKTIEPFISNSTYPIVFCADMNNTSLSYLYRQVLDKNLKDTFLESGQYYGKTFNFSVFPVRLDMIFIDENLKSSNFKNYKINFSDHFPVMTEVHFK